MSNDSMPFYFKSKADLLARLESLRPMVKKLDAESTAKHKEEERRWLRCFRATVRARSAELLKLDYEAAKYKHRYGGVNIHARDEGGTADLDPPNCPVSMLELLDRAIASVQRAQEQRFRINPRGQYDFIHRALMLGIDKAGAVC